MKIEATSRTPLIEINSGYCLIKGECYPEDISEISIPIMKEIEQDVVPVGFIDDGSQYINEIENKEQSWIQTPYDQDDVEDWI